MWVWLVSIRLYDCKHRDAPMKKIYFHRLLSSHTWYYRMISHIIKDVKFTGESCLNKGAILYIREAWHLQRKITFVTKLILSNYPPSFGKNYLLFKYHDKCLLILIITSVQNRIPFRYISQHLHALFSFEKRKRKKNTYIENNSNLIQ